MIVVCPRCQAKFRVADEKVGPRGAKVRCSRCQNVFLVHLELGSMSLEQDAAPPPAPPPEPAPPRPGFDLDLETGTRELGRSPSAPAPADPFAAPAAAPARPQSSAPIDDPFLSGHTAPAASAAPDPFAAAPGPPAAPSPDPFAAAMIPGFDHAPPGLADPFAAAHTPTPVPSPSGGRGPAMPADLPVTDLSDLRQQEPPAPAPFPADDPDFSLEDRSAPSARPRVNALEAAAEAVEASVAALAAERHEPQFFSEAGEESIGLATETTPEPPRIAGAPAGRPPDAVPTPAPGSPAPLRRRAGGGGDDEEAELLSKTIAQKLPRLRRASRLRKTALNAVALASLVLLALALLVLWRSGGRLEPGALRPSAVLRVLGGQPPTTAFAALEVTSGSYERAQGPPLLFVRGRAISRAPGPVRALTVSVEVVRRGEVVARGKAIAGALLTPEELHGVVDAPGLAGLVRSAESRAPPSVKPGDVVPFLVAIADYPGDLEGAALRLEVSEGAPGASP